MALLRAGLTQPKQSRGRYRWQERLVQPREAKPHRESRHPTRQQTARNRHRDQAQPVGGASLGSIMPASGQIRPSSPSSASTPSAMTNPAAAPASAARAARSSNWPDTCVSPAPRDRSKRTVVAWEASDRRATTVTPRMRPASAAALPSQPSHCVRRASAPRLSASDGAAPTVTPGGHGRQSGRELAEFGQGHS